MDDIGILVFMLGIFMYIFAFKVDEYYSKSILRMNKIFFVIAIIFMCIGYILLVADGIIGY